MNIEEIRKDFPMLKQDYVFLDNCATTLKPMSVMQAVQNYYLNVSANAGRGDYKNSYVVDEKLDSVRQLVSEFIGAKEKEEIVFTSGTTQSLGMVIDGYFRKYIHFGDVILTTKSEHASCILPLMRLCKDKGSIIKYIPLDEEGNIILSEFEKMLDQNVKFVAISQITNVLGNIAPVKEICKLAHTKNVIVLVDGAQSVPHMPINVLDLDCDFLAFSGHKMCGPTGLGVLYGKYELLSDMEPLMIGGGSNVNYFDTGEYHLKNAPYKFEVGTLPIAEIFGFENALKYLTNIGMKKIQEYEFSLKKYAISELQKMSNVILYNANTKNGIITFNINGVYGTDVAKYLDHKKIAIRSGQHCSRLLIDRLGGDCTIRASFYFYNSKEDVNFFLNIIRDVTRDKIFDFIFNGGNNE